MYICIYIIGTMCYSLKASIVSIIIHIVCSFLIWNRGGKYRSIALVLMGVGSMQLAELFIHMDFKANKYIQIPGLDKTNINRFGSILGRYSLDVIQPVVSLFALLICPIPTNLKVNLCIIWFILFFVKLLLVIANYPKDDDFYTVQKEPICDKEPICPLKWNWVSKGNIWLLYITLVVVLVALATDQLSFYLPLAVIHIILSKNFPKVWNASGSCFWGPILIYIVTLYNIPESVPQLSQVVQLKSVLSQEYFKM